MDLALLLKSSQLSITKQPLILAIDDDEDSLVLLSEVLSSMSCSFITATHGHTALLLAQTYPPALILLDVMLPDFNGIEVVQRLKQNPQTMSIPVIAVTALASSEDRDRLILAGCNDYISKPYMLDDLEVIIHSYLSRTRSIA